jgi:hypothetical protein
MIIFVFRYVWASTNDTIDLVDLTTTIEIVNETDQAGIIETMERTTQTMRTNQTAVRGPTFRNEAITFHTSVHSIINRAITHNQMMVEIATDLAVFNSAILMRSHIRLKHSMVTDLTTLYIGTRNIILENRTQYTNLINNLTTLITTTARGDDERFRALGMLADETQENTERIQVHIKEIAEYLIKEFRRIDTHLGLLRDGLIEQFSRSIEAATNFTRISDENNNQQINQHINQLFNQTLNQTLNQINEVQKNITTDTNSKMEELFQIAQTKYSIDLQKIMDQINNLQNINMNELSIALKLIRDTFKQDMIEMLNSNNQLFNNIINSQDESRNMINRQFTQLNEHIEERATRADINEMMMILGGRIIEILNQFEQREQQLLAQLRRDNGEQFENINFDRKFEIMEEVILSQANIIEEVTSEENNRILQPIDDSATNINE